MNSPPGEFPARVRDEALGPGARDKDWAAHQLQVVPSGHHPGDHDVRVNHLGGEAPLPHLQYFVEEQISQGVQVVMVRHYLLGRPDDMTKP